MGGYNETYASGDMSKVIVDNLVGIGAALFSFVTLIGIVLLIRWAKGGKVKL